MWNLEQEDSYFKIFDERKTIVGYFAPEYGKIYPEEKENEIIKEMLKKHENIKGGYLMLPLVKFGIFEENKEMKIEYVEQQLSESFNRIMLWKNLMTEKGISHHKILVSHTDHDMLSITLGIIFDSSIPLEKNGLTVELGKILDFAHKKG